MKNSNYKILIQEEIMKSLETTSELKFWTGGYRENMDRFQLCFDPKLKEYAVSSQYIGYGGPYDEYLDKAFQEGRYFGFGESYYGFGYETYIYDLDFYYLENDKIIKGYLENTLPIINKNEGNIKSYTFYIDGRDFSEVYYFHENGNLKSIEPYHSGGKVFKWNEDGVLLLEGYCAGSRSVFLYRKYNEKGILIDEKTKLTAEEDDAFNWRDKRDSSTFGRTIFPYVKKKLLYYDEELPKTLPDDLNPPNPIINPSLKGEHFIRKMKFYNNSIEKAKEMEFYNNLIEETKKIEAENRQLAESYLKEAGMDVNLIRELTMIQIGMVLKMKKKLGE